MATTKTARSIFASTSIAAAGTGNGSLNLSTTLGALLNCVVTPSGTLTTGVTVKVETSNDGSTWRTYCTFVSGLVSGTVYMFPVRVDETVMYVKVTFSGHAGNAAVCECLAQELTSL